MNNADIKKKRNMQNIIYTTKFYCELCHKEIMMPVYGDAAPPFTSEEQKNFVDWCRHYHWIDFHRVCGICGQIVHSGQLELALNNGLINIHKNYTDEYQKVKRGDTFGQLLIVHEKCIKDENNKK